MLQKHIEDQSNASPLRTTSQCKNDYDASGKDDTKSSPSPIHDTTPDTTLESTSGNSSNPDSGCLSDTDIEARSGTDFEGHSEAKVDTFTEGNGKEIVSRQTVSHRRQSLARQPRPFPFLQLPPEVRNPVYRLLCYGEARFGGARRKVDHYDGVDLSKTNRQIYKEMRLLLYELLVLHIYEHNKFTDWLSHRIKDQLAVITTLNIHTITFLNRRIVKFELTGLELLCNTPQELPNLRMIPNVRIVHIHVHLNRPSLGPPTIHQVAHVDVLPHRPLLNPPTIDPRFINGGDRDLRDRALQPRANYLLSCKLFRTLGHWADPVSSHKLDMIWVCWDYGTLFVKEAGNVKCRLEGCMASSRTSATAHCRSKLSRFSKYVCLAFGWALDTLHTVFKIASDTSPAASLSLVTHYRVRWHSFAFGGHQ
jgi:hypothetical protein